MNTAYVYKWTHIPTMKWYVGVRYAKNCHPNDGYICTSKVVKPMILRAPNEWNREIISIGSSQSMRELEKTILELMDAKNDPKSFNQNNAGAPHGWLIPWNKGLSKEQSHRYDKPSGNKGKKQSEKQKKVASDMAKKRNKLTVICPSCNKSGQPAAMKRWHFENCKEYT